MKIVHKKLEYSKPWSFPDVYLFTGNPILNKEGELVMGRGAAAEVKESYPETPAGLARSTNPVMRVLAGFETINGSGS